MIKNVFTPLIGILLISSLSFGGIANGGGSDGGGNSYSGKPLESYAKDPKKLLSFERIISPILADLEKKDPYNSRKLQILKNLMESVFTKKIWYFVPGPLNQIPQDLLNSAVPTDQAALQSFDRVWVDEDIWNTMSVADQGQLLLHETFMGLKILRFSDARLCEAAYPEERNCFYEGNFDDRIVLKSKDYVDVQKMAIQTRGQYLSMTSDDWVKMIRSNGIIYSWDWFDESKLIDIKEFRNMIWQSNLSNYLPTYGYNFSKLDGVRFSNPQDRYEKIKKVKESCSISASVNGNSLSLKSLSETSEISLEIPLENKIEITYSKDPYSDRLLQRVGMIYPTYQRYPSGGYQSYMVSMGFEFNELVSVSIQEMACETPNCTEGHDTDIRGGFSYLCSDSDDLFKP